MKADRRLTPARPDLAARHLEGRVAAVRFADPQRYRVTAPAAPMRPVADDAAGWDTELLHGEELDVYDIADGWAWGQARLDGYVGYVPAGALAAANGPAPTHRVASLWSNLYGRPVLKSAPAGVLPFLARVAVAEECCGFARIGEHWLPSPQLAPLGTAEPDWVAVAERFTGVPYLWGGRSPAGLDCSGLIQLARQAAGHACPRDSDMQEALGRMLPPGTAPRRGDLVFWRGHVAVMVDTARMVHANGHHMATVIEALAEAAARIEAGGGGPLTRHARLDGEAPDV